MAKRMQVEVELVVLAENLPLGPIARPEVALAADAARARGSAAAE